MKERLYVAAILAGLAVAVILVVVIARFGRYNPSPPSLEKHPNEAIPGQVIFLDRGGCIVRADASGATRERVYCVGQQPGFISWLDADTVVYADMTIPLAAPSTSPPSFPVKAIDLATKKVRDTGLTITPDKFGPRNLLSMSGDRAEVDEEGRLFVVHDGVRTQIADFDVPRYRSPQPMIWSPDGNWLVLQYYHEDSMELWIVSKDGSIRGTIARRVGMPRVSWWIDDRGYSPPVESLPQP